MHSFLVKTSIQFFFILLPVLENHDLFLIFEFLFSQNRKKNIRVGEFLTGSVGLPETFFFFFLALCTFTL